MDQAKNLLNKGNPLKRDIPWPLVLVQGVVAIAIGLYALLAASSARKNIVFVVGLFLLVIGLSYAVGVFRRRQPGDPHLQFRLIRAGIGIATGAIVVVNRFTDFMSLDAARVVLGIGLLGMGLASLVGIAMALDDADVPTGSIIVALLLVVWGGVLIYQVWNDSSSSHLVGWAALVVGLALIGLGLLRRHQRRSRPIPPLAQAG
jgi:uncharacterized membrane protein HdeD (DUF308 family)